jgi:hypothetical protein
MMGIFQHNPIVERKFWSSEFSTISVEKKSSNFKYYHRRALYFSTDIIENSYHVPQLFDSESESSNH